MLWVKSLPIVFIASWFAGLFCLPCIFVNLAMAQAGRPRYGHLGYRSLGEAPMPFVALAAVKPF